MSRGKRNELFIKSVLNKAGFTDTAEIQFNRYIGTGAESNVFGVECRYHKGGTEDLIAIVSRLGEKKLTDDQLSWVSTLPRHLVNGINAEEIVTLPNGEQTYVMFDEKRI